jgi:hypothetical protein
MKHGGSVFQVVTSWTDLSRRHKNHQQIVMSSPANTHTSSNLLAETNSLNPLMPQTTCGNGRTRAALTSLPELKVKHPASVFAVCVTL